MRYRNLQQCIDDLEHHGQLVRIDDEVDPFLEAAEIHRRVYRSGGPAIYYGNVKGSRFPMVSNLFGTIERARFVFRDSLDSVQRLIQAKIDPAEVVRRPQRFWSTPFAALSMWPRRCSTGPVLSAETTIDQLPLLQSWPDDGGAFITLPQVYTENVERPGLMHSNLGMYRIQLTGGEYQLNREVGLHYQIHRGIGVHQAAAIRQGQPLRVNVFVGGTPAMSLAAVMPLPEGMSELTFAGAMAGQRIRMITSGQPLPIYADADFCICGTVIDGRLLPEGPFGDHLGYYSLVHDFPVLRVEHVYHRPGAVWPFTVVGRPPQEDTVFGTLIHELTAPVVPDAIPGVHAVHAVDAAGVHPLMLALGSERYTPYRDSGQPAELLTQANAILGHGQMSLAKYLWIANHDDDRELRVDDVAAFFQHVLARGDWCRDLHFHTCGSIDTLDYSGSSLNQGSKLVVAACGPPRRELPTELPAGTRLPAGFSDPRCCLPGVVAVAGPACSTGDDGADAAVERFCSGYSETDSINQVPLIVIVDDSEFTARTLDNFLWVVFTRSNPAADVYGVGSFVHNKHWGCRGALVIDARIKPHHAPPLVEDPGVNARVDALAARGGPLAKYL